jgi:beta-lactamase regulating signal transducer with metallopeptidase domain
MSLTEIIRELVVLQVQATIVLGALLVAVTLLGRTSPRLRHATLGFGLLGLLLLPLARLLPIEVIAIDPAWVPVDVSPPESVMHETSASSSAAVVAAETSQPSWSLGSMVAVGLALLWSLGAALFAGRLIGLWLGARSLSTHAGAIDERLRGILASLGVDRTSRVRVRLSDRIDAPIVFGVAYSTILLPQRSSTWSDARIEAVLRHELAHVRHADPLWLRIADVGLVLYWSNPLYWLAASRLRLEAEHAADDAVLGSGVRASTYAQVLIDLTRALPPRPRAAWATGASRPSQLRRRIVHILAQRSRELPRMRQIVPVALGSLGAALCTAALYCDRPSDAVLVRDDVESIAIPRGELAEGASATAPSGDVLIEIRHDAFRLRHDRRDITVELRLRDGLFAPEDARQHLITAMFDALRDHVADGDVAVYWVDASVPYATIVDVAYTFGRLGLRDHRFVFASAEGPRALAVQPPVFPSDDPPRAMRIEWAHPGGPRVQLHDDGSASCTTVLTLRPEPTTTYGELIAVATEHRPTDACLGGVIIEAGP